LNISDFETHETFRTVICSSRANNNIEHMENYIS